MADRPGPGRSAAPWPSRRRCALIQRQVAASPAARPVKAKVAAAAQAAAVPGARRYDLEHSMRAALSWQPGVFFLALLLVTRLPTVKPDADAALPDGA